MISESGAMADGSCNCGGYGLGWNGYHYYGAEGCKHRAKWLAQQEEIASGPQPSEADIAAAEACVERAHGGAYTIAPIIARAITMARAEERERCKAVALEASASPSRVATLSGVTLWVANEIDRRAARGWNN